MPIDWFDPDRHSTWPGLFEEWMRQCLDPENAWSATNMVYFAPEHLVRDCKLTRHLYEQS